jgi:hypothetical protein
VALLQLLLLWPQDASAALNLSHYYVTAMGEYCTPHIDPIPYKAYRARRGPLAPVEISSQGDLLIKYPPTDRGEYSLEGVLLNETTGACSYCPYDEPPHSTLKAEYLPSSGIRTLHTPMYGPCFSGLPSTLNRMSCVQNQALHPPDYCGEYFFPDQRRNPHIHRAMLSTSWNPYFRHAYVESASGPSAISNVDAVGNPIPPTQYALGKASVLNEMYGMQVAYANGTSIMTPLHAPYENDPGTNVENWPRWAQHFCRIGCHRDSMLATARPVEADFKDQPQRFYLSRVNDLEQRLIYFRCMRCPPYQAAYLAINNVSYGTYTMGDPRDQGLTPNGQCYPWFGSVPTLKLNGVGRYDFLDETRTSHSANTDGILAPAYTYTQVGVPCPVNHYNDRCAHYFILSGNATVACTPCPAGYHTAGRTGAWFCLPPPGQTAQFVWRGATTMESPLRETLLLFANASTNQSLAWARRDLLGHDWECGTLPEHCFQCSAATGTQGLTPNEFNQKMIVAPLFVWQNCPEGYYCPTALEPPLPCPPALPWSPAGSHSAAQCACRAGTYLNASSSLCVPCPTAADKGCGPGTYLRGSGGCFGRNGATGGGECAPCANKPDNAAYDASGPGIELLNASRQYVGVCAFACPPLTVYIGDSIGCLPSTPPECRPVTAIYDQTGARIFAAQLQTLYDRFSLNTGNNGCGAVLTLSAPIKTYAASSLASGRYAYTRTSCPSPHQYVATAATLYSDHVCANCPDAPPYGTRIEPLPLNLKCAVRCEEGRYFNETGRTCGLCATLDALCNAYHSPQTGYYFQGGGCYGSSEALLPAHLLGSGLAQRCVQCALSVQSCASTGWLNLAATPKCACMPCAPYNLPANHYVATQCGGLSPAVVKACTTSCDAGSWLRGACTVNTTGVCQNCTAFKRGYRRDSDCGSVVDATWTPCGVDAASGVFTPGFYCDGAGAQTLCPNNLTSDPLADAASQCFCPAGTLANGDGATCDPIQCSDAARSLAAPGAGWTSASYMALDAAHSTTECLPCGGTSFSVGDGVGLDACVCPVGSYRDRLARTCVACVSTTCGGSGPYLGVPDTCAAGFDTRPPACACLRPPFLSPSDACTLSACEPGFERTSLNAVGAARTAPVSGSPVHVPLQSSGWQVVHRNDARILQDLVVTSDLDGWGGPSSIQYALWTLQGNVDYNVYAMPAAGLNLQGYDPYTNAAGAIWTAVSTSDLSRCAMEALAVAQWPTPQTIAATTTRVATEVGLVVWDVQAGLRLYLNALEVGHTGTPTWTNALEYTIPILLDANASASHAVALAHAYMPPGGSGSLFTRVRSTFYVATVSGVRSRVLAVSPDTRAVLATLEVPGIVRSMTVMARPNGVHVYIGRAGADRIQVWEWTTLTAGGVAPGTDELFFPAGAGGGEAVALAPVLWPASVGPLFFALAPLPADPIRYRAYGRPRRRLLVADMVQRTLLTPQGLHPLTAPVALAVTGRGQGLLLLIAASEGTLFKLEASACLSLENGVPRYFDGLTGQPATCARSRSCARAAGQVWEPNLLRCVCMPGYYGAGGVTGCTPCAAGQYCPGNTLAAIACPSTQTSLPRATAASDCLCAVGAFYDIDRSEKCVACLPGSWCPNRWTRLPCPGTSTGLGASGDRLPNACDCAPGFAGVACAPCPVGFICPKSTADRVVQFALALSLPSGTAAAACPLFYAALASRFGASAIDYLRRPEALASRLRCVPVPAPRTSTAISDTAVLTLLVDDAHRTYEEVTSMDAYLRDSAASNAYGNASIQSSFSSFTALFNNTPTPCKAGYAPSVDAKQCVCAPGFTSASGNAACAACPAGQYKSKLDAGPCLNCPLGFTSSAGAAACIAFNSNGNGNNNNNGTAAASSTAIDSDNLILIASSVGGGVLLVGLLVWAFVAFSPPAA